MSAQGFDKLCQCTVVHPEHGRCIFGKYIKGYHMAFPGGVTKVWDDPMTEDLVQMAKDAARYRFMRDEMDPGTIEHMAHSYGPDRWDACVDEAMAEFKEQE